MSRTYDAVLQGNCLQWTGTSPPDPSPVEVKVIVPDPEDAISPEERKRRAVAALQEIAARGGIRSIPDPVEWQREMRTERPIAGREE